ncbi:ejaculatory bulb-specific protein 3-like [Odontomachus brunneus]|uniref:ejaculatory bulb-specific protein 3-like n=1 Tax=Odontomachus brunneus TaxID=486640 RepID=UPI0013F2406E|nr:ejaculatory bulb-specific protein 3-like [Odontomachus brunneus]
MKFSFVLLFGFAFFELVRATELYADTYDNVDIDAILNNLRLFNQYMNCILENGSCTADGRNLRRILPEAVATCCEKCTSRQKEIAKKISIHLKENKPDIWTMFIEKFDPKKEYITAFEKFLAQKEE